MPFGVPPKLCPLCGQGIWPAENVRGSYEAQSAYHGHLYKNHQEYEKWDRRTSYYYAIPVLVFLASLLPAWLVQVFSGPVLLPGLIVLSSFALALALGIAVWLFKKKGTNRFRVQWNEQQSLPMRSQ